MPARLRLADDELSCLLRSGGRVGIDLGVQPLIPHGDLAEDLLGLVGEALGDFAFAFSAKGSRFSI